MKELPIIGVLTSVFAEGRCGTDAAKVDLGEKKSKNKEI